MTPYSSYAIRPIQIRTSATIACFALLWSGAWKGGRCQEAAQPRIVDLDAPQVAAVVLDLERPGISITEIQARLDQLVMLDAESAWTRLRNVMETTPTGPLRESAAKWLAVLGDRAGLDVEAEILKKGGGGDGSHIAARLLGARGSTRDAEVMAPILQEVARRALAPNASAVSPEDRALLKYGAIAMARLRRPEDRALVRDIVASIRASDFAEALGYGGDDGAKAILWNMYKDHYNPKTTCSQRGLGVPELLALSRDGDSGAIALLTKILRGESGPPMGNERVPVLCVDREQAFMLLRARDSSVFGDLLLSIAASEPEGPWTVSAWRALGVMHPRPLAERILALAVSKRPHWKDVSRDLLNKVVVAANPELNLRFWSYFDRTVVPMMSAERSLVNAGASHLMFSGTEPWTGD